jgi:hypothetical protein
MPVDELADPFRLYFDLSIVSGEIAKVGYDCCFLDARDSGETYPYTDEDDLRATANWCKYAGISTAQELERLMIDRLDEIEEFFSALGQAHSSEWYASPAFIYRVAALACRPQAATVSALQSLGFHPEFAQMINTALGSHQPQAQDPSLPSASRAAPRVFLSYVRLKDQYGEIHEFRDRLAQELGLHLDGDPADVFLDTESIAPGQVWNKELEEAVSQASAMVVLLSPAFLKRDWCRKEVLAFTDRMAVEGKSGKLFPVRWIVTQSDPHDDVLKRIESHQAVDWTDLRHEDWSTAAKRKALSELARAVAAAVRSAQ